MTREDLLAYHKQKCQEMNDTMKRKNNDYCSASNDKEVDPFHNFRQIESLGLCSAEVGIVTRMLDKLARISSFIKNGDLQVKEESVEDTLMDLANYSIILSAFIKDKYKEKQHEVNNVDASSYYSDEDGEFKKEYGTTNKLLIENIKKERSVLKKVNHLREDKPECMHVGYANEFCPNCSVLNEELNK